MGRGSEGDSYIRLHALKKSVCRSPVPSVYSINYKRKKKFLRTQCHVITYLLPACYGGGGAPRNADPTVTQLPKGAVGLQVVGRLIGGALPLVVVGRVDLPALRDGEAGVVPGWGREVGSR